LVAEHINVFQVGNANEGELKVAFESVLKKEFGDLAKKMVAQQEKAITEALGKIHVEKSKLSDASFSIVGAFSAAASGDRLMSFEIEPYISSVSDFLTSNPKFCQFLFAQNEDVCLQNLPRALKKWESHCTTECSKENLVFMKAITDFLACNYGFALATIDLFARRRTSPQYKILAAECALNLGQYSVALEHLEVILNNPFKGYQEFGFEEKIRHALLWSNFGACKEGILESEEAVDAYRHALDILPQNKENDIAKLSRALIQNNLGFSLMTISNERPHDSNLAEAEKLFLSALKIREDERDSEQNICVVLLNLAEVRRKQGDPGDEMDYIDQAMGLLSRLDYPHPLHASVISADGRAAFDRGDYTNALRMFRQSRTKLREVFGSNLTERHVLASYNIAQTLESLGDPSAVKALQTALTQSLEVFQDEMHPMVRMIEDDLKHLS
jgi:tetratricopeptide (TPR) repeat protein